MFITITSNKKNIGFKGLETTDVIVGFPICFILLILFSYPSLRILSLILLVITLFMFIPINVSKKNRMYKVLFLFYKYIIRKKQYVYFKEEKEISNVRKRIIRFKSCK